MYSSYLNPWKWSITLFRDIIKFIKIIKHQSWFDLLKYTTQTVSSSLLFIKELHAIINDLRNKILDRLHAQKKKLCLIIVVGETSNFRQEIRYSYYRNDPVKYDLNFNSVRNSSLHRDFQTIHKIFHPVSPFPSFINVYRSK